MGKYFQEAETVRVDFPDGEWVDIKAELTQADSDYVMNKLISGSDGLKVNLNFAKLPMLERAIVAWSFKDGENTIPVTPENISKLRGRYRQKVLTEIDRLNAEATAFQKN